MARSRSSSTSAITVKPLRSRGYGAILAVTLLAMLIGCTLIIMEIWGDYGGDMQAIRKTPTKVPSALPPAEKLGPAPAPVPGPKPVDGNP